ncbi:protein-disulfide reductase DsbD [Acinetobacter sp. CAAS 2-6]|uniref:protein-disulfide reductase DsbD n=1 Tax=Acinetobacter sp. CAAS 2-6 TaxID=3016358 RepID=UPI002DD6857E|nr:protein-disulfide reductase DsbD [Acinetobacter sp. CAAS 2-6]
MQCLEPGNRVQLSFAILLSISCWLISVLSHAENPLLPPEQAFRFSVESLSQHEAELHWQIEPGYYLYQHKIELKQAGQTVPLRLPPAVTQYDDNYGQSQVYFQQLDIRFAAKPAQSYQLTWQGCAKDRICYPPQTIEFQTDLDGLIQLQETASSKRLLDLAPASGQTLPVDTATSSQPSSAPSQPNPPLTLEGAQDQVWFQQLAEHSLFYSLLLFLGLGVLLAFTPCSLPMLPILTSLIVRDHKGLKAWMIALVFVLSMAMVYALLGLVASSAGLNFQRWLQQPATLLAFSALFVLFAANLFGLFEIRLPQAWLQRLDQMQSLQQGGTLLGAGIMGIISALLVGPCMTAPLAGALLFILQTQHHWQGALLLFMLGFGMGLPLLLASVLGAKVLPKAGQWMLQIRVIFAFIMLGLALYFIRPLLPALLLQVLSLLLGIGLVAYLIRSVWRYTGGMRVLYLLLLIVLLPYLGYSQYQQIQNYHQSENLQKNQWQMARTAAEFEHLLVQAPAGRAIVIDVYADWCVACQPIEHRILKSSTVQQALAPYYLIKLDLSQYDASHQALLKKWQILGPPTYIFLNAQQQEQRQLRLTGAFSEVELLSQLKQLHP